MMPVQPTSLQAAQSIRPHAPTLRERVYQTIDDSGLGGMTDEDIVAATSLNPSTVRPRRGECVAAGLVVDVGTRRRLASGRYAIVWYAKINLPVSACNPRGIP